MLLFLIFSFVFVTTAYPDDSSMVLRPQVGMGIQRAKEVLEPLNISLSMYELLRLYKKGARWYYWTGEKLICVKGDGRFSYIVIPSDKDRFFEEFKSLEEILNNEDNRLDFKGNPFCIIAFIPGLVNKSSFYVKVPGETTNGKPIKGMRIVINRLGDVPMITLARMNASLDTAMARAVYSKAVIEAKAEGKVKTEQDIIGFGMELEFLSRVEAQLLAHLNSLDPKMSEP